MATKKPYAPSFFTAKRDSLTRVSLNWTNTDGEDRDYTGIKVWRRDNGGAWKVIAVVNGSTSSYTDETVKPGNSYTYCVTAYNSAGSTDSSYVTVSTTYVTPQAPSWFRVTKDSQSRVSLSWQNNQSDVARVYDGLRIYRRVDGGGWQVISTVPPSTSSYTDSLIDAGHSYSYYVEAYNKAGSAQTPIASTSTYWQVPLAPTWVRAEMAGEDKISLSWINTQDQEDRQYTGVRICRAADGGNVTLIDTLPPSTTSYDDENVSPNTRYRYYVQVYNPAGATNSATVAATTAPSEPLEPSDVVAQRLDDGRNQVTWTRNVSTTEPYSSIQVYVSINDGGWSLRAIIAGTSKSYIDTGCAVDRFYKYKIRALNASGATDFVETDYVYNTPCAPGTPSGQRVGESGVSLTIPNSSKTATGGEIQRSTDCKTWETIAKLNAMPTSFTDEPGAGTYYYRARNTRDALTSAWSSPSAAVVSSCKPAKPTLLEPASYAAVDLFNSSDVELAWQHNPLDGSAQTYAEIQYRFTGWKETCTTTAGPEQRVTFELISTTEDIGLDWRVRTRGISSEMSDWSEWRTFRICHRPTVGFVTPEDGDVVEVLPLPLRISYDDPSGAFASAALSVICDDVTMSTVELSPAFDPETGHFVTELTRDMLALESGKSYVLEVIARSTTGLADTARISIEAQLALPNRADIRIMPDPETGYVALTLSVAEGGEDIEELALFRVFEGKQTLVAKDISDGETVVDRYAPLNREFSYMAVAYAASGASVTVENVGRIVSQYAFFYFGENIARMKYGPEAPVEMTRPLSVQQYFAGRADPVDYDMGALSINSTPSAYLMDAADARAFEDLMKSGGRCVYKALDGHVMHAITSVTLTPNLTTSAYWGVVEASVTKVDGDEL